MSVTKIFCIATLLLCVTFVAIFSSRGQAQPRQRILGNQPEEQGNLDGVILPFDRNLSRGMQHARKRIAEGEYTQAIRFLDEVLREEQDSFLEIGETGEHAGLKAMARRVIRDLPREGRQAYEITFAPVARRELQVAVATGDLEEIQRIAGQYFYTPAGYEAAFLLAQFESDRGQHLAAALLYQQLLETPEAAARFEPQLSVLAAISSLAAGNQSQALSIIEDLRAKPFREVSIAGEEYELSALGREPLGWLREIVGEPRISDVAHEDQWLTYRGNAARNGQVEGGLPHMRLHWRSRLLSHPKLEELYDEISTNLKQYSGAMPVATVPLAVGDYIITRSPHSLVAVDFRTGKLVWQAEPQRVPEFDRLIEVADAGSGEANANPSRAFSRRIWNDFLYSSISSDGQRVYVLRDLSSANFSEQNLLMMPIINGRRRQNIRPATNRLCAFELATQGKLVWEIDGAASQGPFKDVFFLGAPLAVGQSLYCLAETKDGEIFLAVLDRETGELQWRQQLAELESAILGGATRRLQASVPSYDAGILVCPTGAGAVIGIDLARNALAWAYRYQTNLDPIRAFRRQEALHGMQEGKWIDSAVIIADGRVLLTPPESDLLHCIDLETGELFWKKKREHRLFVAGVHSNRVVLVGKGGVSALRLDTGSWAWQTAKIPFSPGVVPTGRGFTSKGKYYLPLSSAEVIAIDLEIGAIVDRTKARDGQLLGNLICHRGAVISQDGQYLVRFDQVDVLRSKSEQRLEQTPDDFEALRTLGEIAYNEGQLPRAIDLLSKAHHSSPEDLRTREVLSEALVVALDENFAGYRDRLPLLNELHESVEGGLITLLRLQSHGLLEIDDPVGAFEVCVRLYSATEDRGAPLVMQLGQDHVVEVSRWVRAQVAAIWTKADEGQREQLASLVEGLTSQIAEDSDGYQLERLCESFGSLNLLSPVLMRLAKSYSKAGRALEAQQLFLYLANSASSDEIRGEAVARCSLGLHQLRFNHLAGPFDEQLRTTYAKVSCLDDQTGQQFYENLYREGQIGGLSWPYGKVQVSTISPKKNSKTRLRNVSSSNIYLERSDELLSYCNVLLSARTNELIVRDSYGREFFRTTLGSNHRIQLQDSRHVYGVSRGGLLVVSFGEQIMAFDTLSSAESGVAKPLWHHNVVSSIDDSNRQVRGQVTAPSGRPGSKSTMRAQRNGKWIGTLGPLSHDSCVFQDQGRLVCVDSRKATENERWSRSDVPLGCDLFGDEQYVIAVPPGSKKALLFSTIDGRSLGEVTSPRRSEQLLTRGRQVIRWRKRADGRYELSAFDIIAGETLWEHDFDHTAKIDVAVARFVAIVEASGHCTIVDAADGQAVVDQPTSPILKINEVHLLAGADSFVLTVGQQTSQNPIRHTRGLNRSDYVIMNGLVYAFDRETGDPRWARPAKVVEQAFMLAQPVDLPIVAFVGNTTPRDVRGGRPGIRMLVLEKASGRQLVYNNELPGSNGNHCVVQVSEKDSNEVVVEMALRTVSMHFSDLPRPPEPPGMSETATGAKRGEKGLLGIWEKIRDGG
ncbi:MAG: PQQ-binding-like beta-propeller repeat protein [Planctomycetes bacterium]|nr:PQQ-binding-like beta-propeller repeat protein [Planctomycetota bacterium]